MSEIRRILFPTDFSENSKFAIPYVKEYARNNESEIILMHVLEPLISTSDFTWAGLNFAEVENKRGDTIENYMEEMLQEFRSVGLTIRSRLVHGKSHELICSVALEENVDLIILSTHGHRGLTHLLMGSTAEMVVRTAPCPVLTIKDDGKKAKKAGQA